MASGHPHGESNEGPSGSVSPYAVVLDGRNAGDGVPYGNAVALSVTPLACQLPHRGSLWVAKGCFCGRYGMVHGYAMVFSISVVTS